MKSKKDLNTAKNFNATIAGLLIGIGVIINTQTKPPILGALLFSFGLLTIIHLKLPLYTGRIGFLNEDDDLPNILLFNLIGIAITFSMYCFANPNFYKIISTAAEAKFEKTYLQMLLGGFFCGILIHFAVKCKVSYITSMAVIIFILIGAEHCIADFPYFITTPTFSNLGKFCMVILGNSIGAILIERSISHE